VNSYEATQVLRESLREISDEAFALPPESSVVINESLANAQKAFEILAKRVYQLETTPRIHAHPFPDPVIGF